MGPTPTYRIADWKERFENNQTRCRGEMFWVKMSNSFDDHQVMEVIGHGDATYAAWIATVLVASKCKPRGTLIRPTGKPHTARSLSVATRVSEQAFNDLFEIGTEAGLFTTDIEVEQSESEAKPEPAKPEVKEEPSDADFDRFWEAYPNKKGRKAAQRAWKKADDKPPIDELVRIVQSHALSDDWTKDGGKFIPHPATWLDAGRWDDEIDSGGSSDFSCGRDLDPDDPILAGW